jgi:hypothetical protein
MRPVDPYMGSESGSGSREGKTDPQKKVKKFHVLGCSFLRAEGFSCSLDVLYGGGLGIANDHASYDILAQP